MMRYAGLLLALPLCAHTLYLMPKKFRVQPGEAVLLSIHNGDAFPASEDAIAPERVRDLAVPGGSHEELRVLGKATHAFIKTGKAGSAVVSLRTAPRSFELPPAKFEAYLKEEGLEHAIAWRAQHGEAAAPGRERYSKYAKTLIVSGAPGAGFDAAAGLTIEFVLEADPSLIKPGGSLPVKVLLRGKPAAGLRVEASWAAAGKSGHSIVGRTGTDGRITVPLDKAAIWRLHTVSIERTQGVAEADWESYWATFTFELP